MRDRLRVRGEECPDSGTTSDPGRASDSSENMKQSGKGLRAATLGMLLLEAREANRGPGLPSLVSKLYVRL